jgi:hypothetical protein
MSSDKHEVNKQVKQVITSIRLISQPKSCSWHTNPKLEMHMKFGEVTRGPIPLGSYL